MVAPVKTQIFVSSTSDLESERRAVRDGIDSKHARVYLYEGHRTGGGSIRERLTRELKRSDLYIGVYSKRYGSLLPDSDPERSITEWEFDVAHEQDIEIQAYANDHRFKKEEVESRQAHFLKKIRDFDVTCVDRFDDEEDLKQKVKEAYDDYRHQFFERIYELQATATENLALTGELPERKKYWLLTAGLIVVVASVAATVFGAADETSAFMMISVATAVTIAGVLILD